MACSQWRNSLWRVHNGVFTMACSQWRVHNGGTHAGVFTMAVFSSGLKCFVKESSILASADLAAKCTAVLHTCVCMCVFAYNCTYTCVYECAHECINTCVCVCVGVCVYMCLCHIVRLILRHKVHEFQNPVLNSKAQKHLPKDCLGARIVPRCGLFPCTFAQQTVEGTHTRTHARAHTRTYTRTHTRTHNTHAVVAYVRHQHRERAEAEHTHIAEQAQFITAAYLPM